MINSAVIWYSSCNDVYGVVAFDDNEYDCNYALTELLATNLVLANEDSIKFQAIEDDDDEIFDYLEQSDDSMSNPDDYKLIIATGHEIIKRI